MDTVKKTDLLKKLYILTDEEQFYRNLYAAEKTSTSLQAFLSGLSREQVKKRDLIVPEWPWTLENRDLCEPYIFKQDLSRNVYIRKHACYTPAFLHHHSFFEFVYVLDGFCTQTIKQNEFRMETGDFCLISPDVNHTIQVFDESIILNIIIRKSNFDDIFFNFLRRQNTISAFCSENLFKRYAADYLLFHTGCDDELKDLVLEMFVESETEEKYDLELLDYQVLILFTKILKKYGDSCTFPAESQKPDLLSSEILSYIQTNYADTSLSQIAGHFHYSEEYTSRLIKRLAGMTLQQILQRIRMNKAKNFLSDTNISIEEIGHEVGYQNPEHFNRTFRKAFSMTPGEYRRQNSK